LEQKQQTEQKGTPFGKKIIQTARPPGVEPSSKAWQADLLSIRLSKRNFVLIMSSKRREINYTNRGMAPKATDDKKQFWEIGVRNRRKVE